MKKSIIIAIFTVLVSNFVNAQARKNFYSVVMDTIQEINWPKYQTIENACRENTVEYTRYWTDKIVWEYDLVKKTATWKGGPTTQVYKIYSVSNYGGVLTLTIGDNVQIGWTAQIKNQQDGTILFTSRNVELVDGKADGYFSRNVQVASR
jgi:hypothetical protein